MPTASPEAPGGSERRKVRVLVVDDSAAVRDGLRSILGASSDLEVVGEAADGTEALAKNRELRPDVVLMDAQMPGMDGITATRRIKEEPSPPRVIVMTVYMQIVDDALAAGADGCMMKDSGRQEMVLAVKELGWLR